MCLWLRVLQCMCLCDCVFMCLCLCLREMTDATKHMNKNNTQPFMPAPSPWSFKICPIKTAGSANNGRHYRVICFFCRRALQATLAASCMASIRLPSTSRWPSPDLRGWDWEESDCSGHLDHDEKEKLKLINRSIIYAYFMCQHVKRGAISLKATASDEAS